MKNKIFLLLLFFIFSQISAWSGTFSSLNLLADVDLGFKFVQKPNSEYTRVQNDGSSVKATSSGETIERYSLNTISYGFEVQYIYGLRLIEILRRFGNNSFMSAGVMTSSNIVNNKEVTLLNTGIGFQISFAWFTSMFIEYGLTYSSNELPHVVSYRENLQGEESAIFENKSLKNPYLRFGFIVRIPWNDNFDISLQIVSRFWDENNPNGYWTKASFLLGISYKFF